MQSRHGFTLIELSIVLVIIGLIVAGVLVGRDLIAASQQRKFIAEWEKIDTSVQTFRTKYNALPGDFNNAEYFWGTASGGCYDGSRTSTQTCNGNDDGHIGASAADPSETFNFWQHLANAGLIDGTFTGRTSSPNLADAGSNAYESKAYKGVGLEYRFALVGCVVTQVLGLCNMQGHNYANSGTNSSNCGYTGWYNWCPYLSVSEAKKIDEKVDDGKAATGRWLVNGSEFNPGCTTTDDPTTSVWNTSSDGGKYCSFNVIAPW